MIQLLGITGSFGVIYGISLFAVLAFFDNVETCFAISDVGS